MRRRIAAAAAVAAVAVLGVTGARLVHSAIEPAVSASHRVTVHPPGPRSPAGLVASGAINGIAGRSSPDGRKTARRLSRASASSRAAARAACSWQCPVVSPRSSSPSHTAACSTPPAPCDRMSIIFRCCSRTTLSCRGIRWQKFFAFAVSNGARVKPIRWTAYTAQGTVFGSGTGGWLPATTAGDTEMPSVLTLADDSNRILQPGPPW